MLVPPRKVVALANLYDDCKNIYLLGKQGVRTGFEDLMGHGYWLSI